jgi:hypothetical protein
LSAELVLHDSPEGINMFRHLVVMVEETVPREELAFSSPLPTPNWVATVFELVDDDEE